MASRGVRIGAVGGAGVLVGFGLTLLFAGGSTGPERGAQLPAVSSAPQIAESQAESLGDAVQPAEPRAVEELPGFEINDEWRTAPVADFKRALYELDIDSVDRLEELEAFVATGDADPRAFWDTDWTGIDDWKEDPDDFRLERLEDGSLVFVPGEQTRRTYTFFETMNEYEYDEATGEFVYETDFYGKPITNIVKFLRQDVMVMMVVSGQKVDMNLYELSGSGPGL